MAIGPLYGIGAGMLFAPSIHLMSEWFKARKSLAYGMMCVIATAAFKNCWLTVYQFRSRGSRWSRIASYLGCMFELL